MPSRYQQHFYRAAFFLLCVAPTVYTISLIVERRIASASAAIAAASAVPAAEEELSRLLGAEVSLASMDYVGRRTLLTNVRLHDPETKALLATADSVELYKSQDGTLAIEPTGLVLQTDQLSRLAEMFHGRIIRELPPGAKVVAGCPTVQLLGGPREETLAKVDLTIETTQEGSHAVATFHPAWNVDGHGLQLEIIRRQGDSRHLSSIVFNTGNEALPASWLQFALPSLARLGDACQLQGRLEAREESHGWESIFSGVLSQVELDRLVARRLRPYPLGTATLQVDHARWHGGRLVETEGLLEAEALQLSWGTIAEAFLAVGIQQQPVLSEESWRNSLATSRGRLHCRFTLDHSGISMLGKNGIILLDDKTPLFGQPQHKLGWTHSLVKFCSEIGIPPLEVMPLDDYPTQGNVRLRNP